MKTNKKKKQLTQQDARKLGRQKGESIVEASSGGEVVFPFLKEKIKLLATCVWQDVFQDLEAARCDKGISDSLIAYHKSFVNKKLHHLKHAQEHCVNRGISGVDLTWASIPIPPNFWETVFYEFNQMFQVDMPEFEKSVLFQRIERKYRNHSEAEIEAIKQQCEASFTKKWNRSDD